MMFHLHFEHDRCLIRMTEVSYRSHGTHINEASLNNTSRLGIFSSTLRLHYFASFRIKQKMLTYFFLSRKKDRKIIAPWWSHGGFRPSLQSPWNLLQGELFALTISLARLLSSFQQFVWGGVDIRWFSVDRLNTRWIQKRVKCRIFSTSLWLCR